jgi:glutathione S-transferase
MIVALTCTVLLVRRVIVEGVSLTFIGCSYDVAANSHGPIAIVKSLGLEDIEIVNAYGKTRSDEFIKMNPCHTAPTLELADGTAIWESGAIMRYLCNISGEKGETLYPKDPFKRAQVDMVLDWRQTSFYPQLTSTGYIIFGFAQEDAKAQADFKKLLDEIFPILTGTFLKDTPFIYSDTPTIADLAVAPAITFLMARKKFWAKVPEDVKAYYTRVLEAFPDTKENFDMLAGMADGCTSEGYDLEPEA